MCYGIRFGLGVDRKSLDQVNRYYENLNSFEISQELSLPLSAEQHKIKSQSATCSYCEQDNCNGCVCYYPDYKRIQQERVLAARSLLAEVITESQEDLWKQYKSLAKDPCDENYANFTKAYWQHMTIAYWSSFSNHTQNMFLRYQKKNSSQRFPTNYHDALNRRSGRNILELRHINSLKADIEKRDRSLIDKVMEICFEESQDLEDALHTAMVSRMGL